MTRDEDGRACSCDVCVIARLIAAIGPRKASLRSIGRARSPARVRSRRGKTAASAPTSRLPAATSPNPPEWAVDARTSRSPNASAHHHERQP
jgi:hypothetical protein